MNDDRAIRVIGSRLGPLVLGADRRGLLFIDFGDDGRSSISGSDAAKAHLDQAEAELDEYFAGRRTGFDVSVMAEGTAFQRGAWEALRSIDYGTAISYGEQARRMGRPTAVRAVGTANGRNPIPIIIPCHRVIAADGSLGGYSAGIDIKRWLLDHERRHRPS